MIYGEISSYKYVSCQSYPDDTYLLCFNNFDSREKLNYFDKHVKPVNSLPSSNYIDIEGNNYFGGGSGSGGGSSDPASGFTIERVSVYGVTVGKMEEHQVDLITIITNGQARLVARYFYVTQVLILAAHIF